MICRAEKSRISGSAACPANKSYTHRAIFLASLAGHSRVENALLSADTLATVDACRRFGATMEIDGSTISVKDPINPDAAVPEINAENSGTTIRLASGIAGLYGSEIVLTGDQSLRTRPMQPLLDALSQIGARTVSDGGRPPIRITGRISGGDVSIAGDVSSQFVSSLLICAPLTKNGIGLSIRGDLVSKPYLDATLAAMRVFGASVQTLIPYRRYRIEPQGYRRSVFEVPIDSSSLALLLSAAVLNGDGVTINGDIGTMPQGDEVFIDILEQMGAAVRTYDGQISVGPSGILSGGRFDLSNSPDLLPPLAVLALNTADPIEIVNVRHARLKETDRIAIIARELKKTGLDVQERDDGLILHRTGSLHGARLISERDHRLFMAFCIAGIFVGGCTVTDPDSVGVSYPDFVDEMGRMGADITVRDA